jgi:hypothetical protein
MALVDQRPHFGRGIQRMPDFQTCHPLCNPLDETIVQRAVNQQSARRRAALAVQAVDHEHDRIDGAIQVGVLEHDHRILATELQVHAFQGRGTLTHDETAGARLADESRRPDGGMLGEQLAGALPDPIHQIHHARGHARFGHDLGEQRRRQWAPLGGLVDDRASRGQGGRDLPRRQHERRIPRRNDRHGTDRLPGRVVQVLGGR